MSYVHDVFISYKRDEFKDEWLSEHFIRLFLYYAREEIAAACNRTTDGIYFDQTEVSNDRRKLDQTGLEPGDEWRKALREAIKTSRCIVCLWSPLYFHSRWCRTEWYSFRDRGAATGTTIVTAMSVHDGESFPKEAQDFKAPDFSDFVIVGEGFKKTEDYPKFQKQLRTFAITVAKRVRDAPPYADFPVIDVPDPVFPPLEPDVPQQRLR